MLKPKCFLCKEHIERGDGIFLAGEWPGMGPLLPPVLNYPYLKRSKFYHKTCFASKTKKK